jgi:hypothetical protein
LRAAVRASAPSSPISLSAAVQHPRPRTRVSVANQRECVQRRSHTRGADTGSAARGARSGECSLSPHRAPARRPRPCAQAPQPSNPRQTEHARAHPRSTDVIVVFFKSAAARAIAPSSPMPVSAPATPNASQRHRSKGVRAEALAHARGPTLARRALPKAHARAPPRSTDVTVVFFLRAAARAFAPSSPTLLSAAVQHPRPRTRVSVTIQRGAQGARTRAGPTLARARAARGAQSRECSLSPHRAPARRPRPCAQAPQPLQSPATEHARALLRSTDVAPCSIASISASMICQG